MIKRILPIVFIIAVIAVVWYRPAAEFGDLGEGDALHQFALPNGLQVYVIPQHRTRAVNHTLWVKVGSAHEPEGKTGVAHYLEHLMFKGTLDVPSGEYSRLIEELGGSHNAFTSDDFTGYYVTVAREHLEAAMLLEADRFMNLAPDAEESARELQVVLEERAQRVENQPAARLGEKLGKALYGAHPYAHPIIGWPDELAKLTLADAMEFYRAHYHAGNMVLVLAGDITVEAALALAKEHYGKLPAKAEVVREWSEAVVQTEAPITLADAQVKQREWVQHVLMPSVTSEGREQAMPLMLLSHILGGSTTSHLYQALVVEAKVASDVGVYYQAMQAGPGRLIMVLTPLEGIEFNRLEAALNEALRRFSETGLSEDVIARAKTQFIAESIYARDGLYPLARFLGQLAIIDAPLEYYTHWDALVNRVTRDQLVQAFEVMRQADGVTGYLVPEAKDEEGDDV